MSNTACMGRRGLLGGLATVGSLMSLAACGSATTTSHSPVDACSLMSKAEAAAIFQTGNYTLQHRPPTNDQTVCVYPGSARGVSLITSVSWSKSEVANFEKVHSGTYTSATATVPSGQAFPLPKFTKIRVDGNTVYWAEHQPLPISGTDTYPSLMSAEKNGYVVALSATGLSETQNEQVMGTMLRRL